MTPILKELKDADALIIGTPIYWGFMSASIHNALERMWFSNYSYNPSRNSVYGKKIKTGIIWTMNVTEEISNKIYQGLYNQTSLVMEKIFGNCENLMCYNTTQVSDYSKYDLSMFNSEEKRKQREQVFPHDLQKAFELGKRLVQ